MGGIWVDLGGDLDSGAVEENVFLGSAVCWTVKGVLREGGVERVHGWWAGL